MSRKQLIAFELPDDSFAKIHAWAIERIAQEKLSGTACLVLLFMCLRRNFERRDFFWTQGRISEDLGITRQTVNASMKRLSDAGLIRSVGKREKNGGEVTIYRVLASFVVNERLHDPVKESTHTPVSESGHKQEEVEQEEEVQQQTRASSNPYSDLFEEFWSIYPAKVGKGAAWKAWQKAGPHDFEVLADSIARWKATDRWKRGYIPNPSTWINQRRWEDEPESLSVAEGARGRRSASGRSETLYAPDEEVRSG